MKIKGFKNGKVLKYIRFTLLLVAMIDKVQECDATKDAIMENAGYKKNPTKQCGIDWSM
jgi:hypothetical protein